MLEIRLNRGAVPNNLVHTIIVPGTPCNPYVTIGRRSYSKNIYRNVLQDDTAFIYTTFWGEKKCGIPGKTNHRKLLALSRITVLQFDRYKTILSVYGL